MGYLIDERKFLDTNIIGMESRIQSQYARFLDKAPTYVTYYHINNIESMTDMGFINTERRLGNASSIRYNEITDFPIYGMDELQPDLAIQEEGLNTNISSSGVILPNTITPFPDDLFVLGTTSGALIFRVTNVQLDSIRSNGFYQIDYQLEYTEEEFFHHLERQTTDSFRCIIENIGTEDKVILSHGSIETLQRVEAIASKISHFYRILFYDKRYNSFLYTNDVDGVRLYDSLLTTFMNRNKIFEGKGRYETIMLADEDPDVKNEYAYHESIYRAIEERRPELIKENHYMAGYVNNPLSVFHYWRDNSVMTTTLGLGCKLYIRPEILDLFINAKYHYNGWLKGQTEVDKVGCCRAVDIMIPTGDEYAHPTWVTMDKTPKEEPLIDEVDETVMAEHDLTHPDNDAFDKMVIIQPEYSDEPSTQDTPKSRSERLRAKLSPEKEFLGDIEVEPEPVEENTVFNKDQQYEDELEQVVKFRGQEDNFYLSEKGEKFEIKRVGYEYVRKSQVPLGESIIHHVIVMYLSGTKINVRDIDLDALERHVEYMKPNHETFILTPILLYTLRKIFDSIYNG